MIGAGDAARSRPWWHSVRSALGRALRRRVPETLPDKRGLQPASVPPPAGGMRTAEEVDECQHAGDSTQHRVLHGRQGRDGEDESSNI